MKKILITTDFSIHSRYTIEYILGLFSETKIPCQLTLLNTYKVNELDPVKVITANDELKTYSRNALLKEKEEVMKNVTNPLVSVDVASHLGSLNNVVLQLIQTKQVDLVAMGKRNGRHVEMMSHMLKKHNCPLLITYLNK